jgi:xanthine dehydrogenase YagS FAD-binding subunit
MKPFAYANARTVEDAVEALSEGCRPLAGGTDLLGLMKRGLAAPHRLVNLKTIDRLGGVEREEETWRIGALTTLSELSAFDGGLLGQQLTVLSRAAAESATPQLRHAATIGGNLLQRPRCWYFRNPSVHCWLKGGKRCFAVKGKNAHHAIFQGGPCYIVHPSDPAGALLALEAQVELTGPEGSRRVKMADFFTGPSHGAGPDAHPGETAVALDELVTAVVVPTPPEGARGAYVKVAERAAWDFALVSAAVQLRFEGDIVQDARVVLGGVAPVPYGAAEAENVLRGARLTAEAVEEAAQASSSGAAPLSENGYKVELVHGVVREALRRLDHAPLDR